MAGRPPFGPAIWKALRLRCPYCGQGRIFRGWTNRVFPRCPHCGLRNFRESGYYLGGMIITYVLTAVVLLAVYLGSLLFPATPGVSEGLLTTLWMTFGVLLTLAFVRPSYSLWLALDFWIAPWTPEDEPAKEAGGSAS